MVGGEATVEQAKSPEVRKASNGLMLHIAHGEFDSSKTPDLKKDPKEIAQKSFDTLDGINDTERRKQGEKWNLVDREVLKKQGWPEDKITPELLKHMHMVNWAKVENTRVKNMFIQINQQHTSDPEAKQDAHDALIAALGKLKITFNKDTDAQNFADQFYKTNPDNSGTPGEFYTEFCIGGNLHQKLLNALQEQDMIVLKDFLTDTLGSFAAYNALLATKQTQDAIINKHDFSTDSTAIALHEYGILDFFKKGSSSSVEGPENRTDKPEKPLTLDRIDGGYTTAKPEHPDRNEDASFLDKQNQRGGIFDGAGGYEGADKAAQAARDAIKEVMDRFPLKGDFPENPITEQFLEAFALANDRVKALGTGMTTAAVFQVVRSREDGVSPKLLVANIGDSRVWIRHKDGTVTQVTRDGNALRDLHKKALKDIPSGSQDPRFQEERDGATQQYEDMQAILDSAQSDNDFAAQPRLKAAWHLRNQTSLLGSDDFKEHVELFESPIAEGDTIFMTTDGVHDNLTRQQIETIAKATTDPDELSKRLVEKARSVADTFHLDESGQNTGDFRAKPDDITAVAMQFTSTSVTAMEQGRALTEKTRTDSLIQTVTSLVQRLDEKTPGADIERLVAEKNFTPDEMIAMRELLHQVTTDLSVNQDLKSLQRMADSYQQNDKAFGIAVAFGGAIKENAVVSTPTFKQDENGTRIEVSPTLYRLWKTYSEAQFLTDTLDDYTAKPLDKTNAVYGRSPHQVARALETLTAYATALEEKT